MPPTLSKKLSWLLLISLFTFDAGISYWAVVFRNAHEANPAIKSIVETYPLLYFLTVPALIPIMYLVYKALYLLVHKLFNNVSQEITEIVILTALVIYWILGNSSINLLFLFGYKQESYIWYQTAILAIIPATIYSVLILKRQSGKTFDENIGLTDLVSIIRVPKKPHSKKHKSDLEMIKGDRVGRDGRKAFVYQVVDRRDNHYKKFVKVGDKVIKDVDGRLKDHQ
ncbi:hypothetical protein HYV64_00795 [Candidatus Shapirobacteria bacterium]|nr:hypothetical protein [Candidatus Shapirobacteria bacterium]